MFKKIAGSMIVFFSLGIIACNAADAPDKKPEKKPEPVVTDSLAYKISEKQGVTEKSNEGVHVFEGKGNVKLVLTAEKGDLWNMDSVSVLGVKFKNTGSTDMIINLMLYNPDGGDWSNSAMGRTIVKAGEEIPLAVALGRRGKASERGTKTYLEMSGLPNGRFAHWHTIDPTKVKRLVITCWQKGDCTFELGDMYALQKMDQSKMGVFPFIDKYGQYMLKEWPNKVHADEDIKKSAELEAKLEKELTAKPTEFDQYGGWAKGPKLESNGRFRLEKYKDKWWFVDPEGYLFFSLGVNCVGTQFSGETLLFERDTSIFKDFPSKDDKEFGQFFVNKDVEKHYMLWENVPHYDFTGANLYRKYGQDWAKKSAERDVERMKYCHLNTIGAWSDPAVVNLKKVPYAAMIHYIYAFAGEKLPDPFDPETRKGVQKSLKEYPVDFKNDPWCIGAFVDNELHWGGDTKWMVISMMGYELPNTAVKKAFQEWLKKKYDDKLEAFNEAWKTDFKSWDELPETKDWKKFQNAKGADCSALAVVYADAYFKMIKEELNAFAPKLLYFGCRFNNGTKEVIQTAAKYVDLISVNSYVYSPGTGSYGFTGKPILLSEYHFVNVSGNGLGGGLASSQDSVQQGRAYNAFVKTAVSNPQIVGAHWFQWRDQNAAGRYDGENYNLGFFDVADQPNVDLIRAVEETGRNLYDGVK